MMRVSRVVLAGAVPRSAWDPSQHNGKWVDSYAKEIADRRVWPARKWSIGLEPRTPTDWLTHSNRNLAYAYNGAMRACANFPEMVPYYQEMKQRGVKVDLDTMQVLLSRGARYEKMTVGDVFNLYDELLQLGARPDIAVAETLHTVWDNSMGAEGEWRAARREQLIDLYQKLCAQDITRYGNTNLEYLLGSLVQRYRDDLKSLGARLDASVWVQYISQMKSFDQMMVELNNFLWDFAPKEDTPFLEMDNLELTIPILKDVVTRLQSEDDSLDEKTFREDKDIVKVFEAAVERVVDYPLGARVFRVPRRQLLVLNTILSKAACLYSTSYLAQALDIVKYDDDDIGMRDQVACNLMTLAVVRSRVADNRLTQNAWSSQDPVDGRVLGRYLAARDPWSAYRFSVTQGTGKQTSFTVAKKVSMRVSETSSEADGKEETTDKTDTDSSSTSITNVSSGGEVVDKHLRTNHDVRARWADVKDLLSSFNLPRVEKGVSSYEEMSAASEVFTGKIAFVRNMMLSASKNSGASFASQQSLTINAVEEIFIVLEEIHNDMERACQEQGIEPEIEAWESLIVTNKAILDYLILERSKRGSTGDNEEIDSILKRVGSMRDRLMNDSLSRHDGRFKMMWLQEF